MDEQLSQVRAEVASLRKRLEEQEDVLDKAIRVSVVSSSAIEMLTRVMAQYYQSKDPNAVYMTIRGVISAMQSAVHALQTALERINRERP